MSHNVPTKRTHSIDFCLCFKKPTSTNKTLCSKMPSMSQWHLNFSHRNIDCKKVAVAFRLLEMISQRSRIDISCRQLHCTCKTLIKVVFRPPVNIECNIIARPYATHAVLKAKQFDYPNSEKRAAILYSEVCIWQIHTDYS